MKNKWKKEKRKKEKEFFQKKNRETKEKRAQRGTYPSRRLKKHDFFWKEMLKESCSTWGQKKWNLSLKAPEKRKKKKKKKKQSKNEKE